MKNFKNYIYVALGPIVASAVFALMWAFKIDMVICKTAFVLAWVATWWVTEAVHLAVASLLPLVLFPTMGIMNAQDTAREYTDQVIFLFVGGFMLAFAMEKWGLHQRIALKILSKTGSSASRILAGIMLSAYLISMWISNTATVMMLFPAVLSIIKQLENHTSDTRFPVALLLGLAYAATIGGMATLVGSPPNMIFTSYFNNHVADIITFTNWFLVGFPISFLLLLFCFWLLKFIFVKQQTISVPADHFSNLYAQLGKTSFEEKLVSIIFGITALAWFFRADIELGSLTIKGWSNLFVNPKYIHDSTVAIAAATIMFIIPSRSKSNEFLLTWDDVLKLPYDIILLFGGGFALAKGFEISGLSNLLAGKLQFLSSSPILIITLGICVFVVILSEFASNAASIQLVLPILSSIAVSTGLLPVSIMLPAAYAASLGFMLPVATAPNTIVFGSKLIKVRQMMIAGFWLNLAGIVLITASILLIGNLVF